MRMWGNDLKVQWARPKLLQFNLKSKNEQKVSTNGQEFFIIYISNPIYNLGNTFSCSSVKV